MFIAAREFSQSKGDVVLPITYGLINHHYGLDDRGSIPDRGRGFFF
jgi:hypothetical protein